MSYWLAAIVSIAISLSFIHKSDLHKSFKSVLLVIAHPDDECMFFSPIIIALSKAKIPIYIICLTNGIMTYNNLIRGNADGLGKAREVELVKSAVHLGVREARVIQYTSDACKDGFNEKWDLEVVVAELERVVKLFGIKQILTFDNKGVSHHPNHIDCYNAVKYCYRFTHH
jgi:N-acetylglucosaminylphosphatidylinositol deacetylase